MRSPFRTICFVVMFGVCCQLANAQTPTRTVTVRTAAPIFLYPDTNRQPLIVAKQGSVLRFLGEEGDWYNIEFRDPVLGPRVGYIQKSNVTPVVADYSRVQTADVSIESTSTAAQPVPAPQRSTVTETPPQAETVSPRRQRPIREGFWFNAGLGLGSLGCDDCFGNRVNGPSGGVVLGGTISPRVLLGVGTTGWARSYFGETLSVGTLDARFRFYPSETSGFFVTLGVGLGSVSFAGESEVGAGAVVGLGIDLRVARNVSITPFWNGFAMRSSYVDANVGQIGLGITVH